MTHADAVPGLVDHLFRRQAGRMVAALVRTFGPEQLDLAEELVQEALVKALQRWPFHGVPDDPAAWLVRVARNLALDRLRREARLRDSVLPRALADWSEARGDPDPTLEGEHPDDTLRLIFMCCHPELPRDARVALTLKAVCGFGVDEIARAFLASPATVAQRLVRAKQALRQRRLPFELPSPAELAARLDSVLEVLYLLFNEGYSAHAGEDLVRADLCHEALRLGDGLLGSPRTDAPVVHALQALMLFQASRLPARAGSPLPVRLHEQDRALWDRGLIARAFAHLERGATGPRLTAYHVQAAIAAEHARAPSEAETDWPAILRGYDLLSELAPSPVVTLNRAVAVARCHGPAAGLRALDAAAQHPSLRGYALLFAVRAELRRECGDAAGARSDYARALELPCTRPERRFLERQRAALDAPG